MAFKSTTGKVVDLMALRGVIETPMLILIDPQREYLQTGHPLGFHNASEAIQNCRQLLAHARRWKFPVGFVRLVQSGRMFNPVSTFSDWIEGLEPDGADMIFERAWPSAYASKEFARVMAEGWGKNVAIAGFTGTISCLATIIEGSQRNHRFSFIADASHSHAIGERNELEAHAMAKDLISLYGDIESTEGWIARHTRRFEKPDTGRDGHHG